MYEIWLSERTSFDPRIGNLLMNFYGKEGKWDEAEGILDQVVELGGKLNSSTWEILTEGQTRKRGISEAFLANELKSWRPKPVTLSYFFDLCKDEENLETKEALVGLLRQLGFLEDKNYTSFVVLPNGALKHKAGSDDKDDRSEVLLDQLQGSM
ncbi:hypothetical protein ACJRO7_018066 [Eucalyptus globulus]|uniref:Pentatricopeptide repeat-containing protein n=1 Tax=Eucalyptus globulus TaxID=34317 RepID=A0ABD3KSD1_EUCGL